MSKIHEFRVPLPVMVEDGVKGHAIYVDSSGIHENDVWCVVRGALSGRNCKTLSWRSNKSICKFYI